MLKLVRRGAVWHLQGAVTSPNGSVFVRETTRCRDRRAAEIVRRRREEEITAELNGERAPRRLLFAEAAAAYLKRPEPLHPFDIDRIEALGEVLGELDVEEVTGERFAEFIERRAEERCPKGKDPEDYRLKPSTVGRWRSTLVAVLNHAKASDPRLVVHRIPTIEQRPPRPRYLAPEDAERLIECYHPKLRPLAVMLCFQGCRIGEALRLDWADVDLDGGWIRFWRTKNDHARTVPLHRRTAQALRSFNRQRRGAVFLSPQGKPYADHSERGGTPIKTAHAGAIDRATEAILKELRRSDDAETVRQAPALAGKVYAGFTVHKWRSHWASWMVMKAGADMHTLMKLGGWRSEESVRHYVDLAPEHLRGTLERL